MMADTTSTNGAQEQEFNHGDLLQSIKSQGGEKPYLNPRNAVTWFYHDNPLPHGRIVTHLVSAEPVIFRAEIYIDEVMVATGHANADGNSNTLKKIESSAIRRALANAGYGTEQIMARYIKPLPVEEAKAKLGAGKDRRIGTGWTDEDMTRFVTKYRDGQGLSNKDILTALGNITGLRDWKGTYADAEKAAQKYIQAQLEPDAIGN